MRRLAHRQWVHDGKTAKNLYDAATILFSPEEGEGGGGTGDEIIEPDEQTQNEDNVQSATNEDLEETEPEENTQQGNFKRISKNSEANRLAEEAGYEDAEELKEDYVPGQGNRFNIYRDNTTGKLQLRDIATQQIKIDVEPLNE